MMNKWIYSKSANHILWKVSRRFGSILYFNEKWIIFTIIKNKIKKGMIGKKERTFKKILNEKKG